MLLVEGVGSEPAFAFGIGKPVDSQLVAEFRPCVHLQIITLPYASPRSPASAMKVLAEVIAVGYRFESVLKVVSADCRNSWVVAMTIQQSSAIGKKILGREGNRLPE
jgi:hypothetical protein